MPRALGLTPAAAFVAGRGFFGFSGFFGRLLAGGKDFANYGRVELVDLRISLAVLVVELLGESAQRSFLAKILAPQRNRQGSCNVFAVCGFVPVLAGVPGKDPYLVEVVRHTILGFGKHGQVFANLLVPVLDLIQREDSDNALAFGVLGDVFRDVQVKKAAESPAHALLVVADQPPVFPDGRLVGFLLVARGFGI